MSARKGGAVLARDHEGGGALAQREWTGRSRGILWGLMLGVGCE